ncbi:MAG TPA: hypothetical protein VGP18_00580 [Solirubrobacteraceae bacterium]|jgi:hypothetical protein|nr:hypothetical protein [Solirubrobacteraceae bacterium]
MSHIRLAALALTAVSLALGGCGGSSKTTASTVAATATTTADSTQATSTTAAGASVPAATIVRVASGTPLTRAQLIAKGDAICAHVNAEVDKVDTQPNVPASVELREVLEGYPKVARYETTETNELSKLVPPAALAHDWGLIVNDFHRYVQYADALASDAEAKNIKAIGPLIQPAEAVHEKLNAIAAHDGFKSCSGVK